jgi:hypothetical protein
MRFFILILLISYSSLAWSQTSERKPFSKFIVYQDKTSRNHYTPSGYMPTGECIKMNEGWQQDCHEGKTCIKAIYDVACSAKSRQWAGVYWLNPPDNWGERKGGYNLTGAKKLVFWAKGEKGGEQIAEFKVGGIGNSREYPDSDTATIGPVILSNEWKEYSIDLRDKDLSYISGGFAWAANVNNNSTSCTFFLDDIHFE